MMGLNVHKFVKDAGKKLKRFSKDAQKEVYAKVGKKYKNEAAKRIWEKAKKMAEEVKKEALGFEPEEDEGKEVVLAALVEYAEKELGNEFFKSMLKAGAKAVEEKLAQAGEALKALAEKVRKEVAERKEDVREKIREKKEIVKDPKKIIEKAATVKKENDVKRVIAGSAALAALKKIESVDDETKRMVEGLINQLKESENPKVNELADKLSEALQKFSP